jgi:cell division protein FtsQ
MNFTKKLQQKISKDPPSFGRKKGKLFSGSPTFSKQKYTPFKHEPSPQAAKVKRSLKKTASFIFPFGSSDSFGKTQRKSKSRLVLFTLCLVIFGMGAFVYGDRLWIEGFFAKIEYFEVGDNVVIRGCHVTTPADIRELAEVRYHTNLFSVNPGRLEAILDKHPWVRSASIHRDWPNRLVIDIVEYVPEVLAVLGKPGHHQLYYMNAQGIPFIAVKPGQDLDYPVITGMEDIKPADKRREALHDAMQFIRLVKRNNPNLPAQSVSEIHLDATDGMVVYLVEYPFPIYFGMGDVAKKCRRLEDVLGALYKQRKDGMLISQVEYIKMNYSENKVLVAHSSSS